MMPEIPDFPFEAVHAHFAKYLTGMDISDGDFPPMIAFVLTEKGQISHVDVMPRSMTADFFSSPAAKKHLGQFLRESIAKFGDFQACAVLICEAYFKEVSVKDANKNPELMKGGSLANDPEAIETVLMQLYTPTEIRMCRMPISADRTVQYADLEKPMKANGRLSLHPDADDLPNDAKFH